MDLLNLKTWIISTFLFLITLSSFGYLLIEIIKMYITYKNNSKSKWDKIQVFLGFLFGLILITAFLCFGIYGSIDILTPIKH